MLYVPIALAITAGPNHTWKNVNRASQFKNFPFLAGI